MPAHERKPGDLITNSIGMTFAWIPPGTFMMGSPKEEEGRRDEETQHGVTLTQGFYMGVHAVTHEHWQAVMGKNPSTWRVYLNLPWSAYNHLPVESVSWDDCQEFIKKLQEKDYKPYRLPTEAEWEYACRSGTTTPFYFGETISTDLANYHGKKGRPKGMTTLVGQFPANAFGLYDTHGNVWEWCQDWYGEYPQKDVIDPQGPNSGDDHVLRGGSWSCDPAGCRSASRYCAGHGIVSHDIGFRLCFGNFSSAN